MPRLFSNGPNKDYVVNPITRLLNTKPGAFLAAPYFTYSKPISEAALRGVGIRLIVGLNPSTSPTALGEVMGLPNLQVRYFTHRFHAKLYIFGSDSVLIGSSNLTDGGLFSNREAVVELSVSTDADAIEEACALYAELWDSAQTLTPAKLGDFKLVHTSLRMSGQGDDAKIEQAVGRSEPSNINVGSRNKSHQQIFLQDLRRQVYEEYRPAFLEVASTLERGRFRRSAFDDFSIAIETNRFLNWVRLTYAPGEEAWQSAQIRSKSDREENITRLGREWQTTSHDRVPSGYFHTLATVQKIFDTKESVEAATKDELTTGLLCIHAFSEQLRFVKGGEAALPNAFWSANGQNIEKVQSSLTNLLHGAGDFIERFHDTLYSSQRKLGFFGYFCALELFGTVKPDQCPPINGRMAKALRYLGFGVRP